MDYRKFLIMAALLLSVPLAHAGYAQMSPPSGWSGSSGNWTHTTQAANAGSFTPGGWRGPGGVVNVGGKAVTVPAAYRFAANAGRFAAGMAFRNPWTFGIATVATWVGQCISVQGGQWVNVCGTPGTIVSDGYEYWVQGYEMDFFPTRQKACDFYASMRDIAVPSGAPHSATVSADSISCVVLNKAGNTVAFPWLAKKNSVECPAGWFRQPNGLCSQIPDPRIYTEPDFVEDVGPRIYPPTMPGDLPKDWRWPQLPPVINPSPDPNDQPYGRPWIVPTGDPRAVPGTDPKKWVQPSIRISPANNQQNPWQVDVQPVDMPVDGPDTGPDPYTPDDPNSSGESPENPDLCALHPEIVACQQLGDVEAVPVPNQDRAMAITPDQGWGPSTGSCPAAKTFTIMGKSMSMPFDLLCDFATAVRPLFIALAWLSAALSFIGLGRKG